MQKPFTIFKDIASAFLQKISGIIKKIAINGIEILNSCSILYAVLSKNCLRRNIYLRIYYYFKNGFVNKDTIINKKSYYNNKNKRMILWKK